jgi:spore coat protein CotH
MASRRVLARTVLAMVLLLQARGVAAQTADDLFNDQVLQRIDLFVNTKDWYLLRANYLSNDYYPANMTWNGVTTTNVAIRSRGTGSRSAVKPALHVDFNKFVTGRTFLGLKSVNLNNMVQDASNIREVLAMKFYRVMGIPAPRTALAALYLNNTYFGLYLIVEEIDETAVARLLGDSAGYLFEFRWNFTYNFEYLGSDLTAYTKIYEPRTRATESASALYAPIEAWTRTMRDASDETFAAAVSEYVDLSAFMRLVAVQAFIAECDGLLGNWGANNHYTYRRSQRNLHQFIVWDASSSFQVLDYPIHAGHAESVLMRRALLVPDLHDLYFGTVLEAAAFNDRTETEGQPGPGWLEREASRLLGLIRTAAYADAVKPYTNGEFDQAAAYMLTFASTRSPFVRGEVARLTGTGQPGLRAAVRR